MLGQTIPLGTPLPNGSHAVSVSMPTWQDVIGYEEGDARIVEALACGYPRFFLHPAVGALCASAEQRYARCGERCLLLPSEAAARRCGAHALATGAAAAQVFAWPEVALHGVAVPAADFAKMAQYWQHSGEIVSSRRAAAATGAATAADADPADPGQTGAAAKEELRARISSLTGCRASDVYLFPTGMSAIFHAHLALTAAGAAGPAQGELKAGRTVQFGFPYIDTLKIQQRLGSGAELFPRGSDDELEGLAGALARERFAALFSEVPTNPLLVTPSVRRLRRVTRARGVPLVLDDSIGAFTNLDLLRHADALVASLTKLFTGSGEVMGGALLLNLASVHYERMKQGLQGCYEDTLWWQDARVLAQTSRDLQARSQRTNANAAALCEQLSRHPAVDHVYHPSTVTTAAYEGLCRPGGGGGGLLSVLLKDPARRAPRFYDRLQVCKGPSFGTNFTLVCPYTLLAHFHELDWAERCGVSRYLVRVWVGQEDCDELLGAFAEAL